MSLDIFLSALGSLGYESCPTEPTLSQRLPGMISLGPQIQNNLTICKSEYGSILSRRTDILSHKRKYLPFFLDLLLKFRQFPAKPILKSSGLPVYRCLWLLNLRFDALDFWSTDARFDGINGRTDATNTYQDHTVDDFCLLHPPQVEDNTTEDVWDHRVDDGMAFSAIAGSISPDATTHDPVQGSAFGGHPSSEHAILTTPPNAITFNGSASTQMDVDSLISGPSTETSAPTSFLQVHELSPARPHAAHSTSLYMPFINAYAAVSSSKTIPNRAFDQDQASGQPVAIMDAKFNSFGRIGGSTVSKRDSKKLRADLVTRPFSTVLTYPYRRKPYQKIPPGPKKCSRKMLPLPPSESHRFADGRHKYERLTDFQIEKLLKIYNVTRDQAPRVFYGLHRQHSPDVLYTCPMDKSQHTLD
ncbi:uncharacterized protein ARMOST_16806 [Armillaria ostoyae]|uniref:Uncharacterized protein n=1 Tax=Armillaria ostoyae TaxID=47428 RepID=A0A284RX78_ARMOS|nr:uncharacterized protein ARMOST_16806 [Armillaria ostoyae]